MKISLAAAAALAFWATPAQAQIPPNPADAAARAKAEAAKAEGAAQRTGRGGEQAGQQQEGQGSLHRSNWWSVSGGSTADGVTEKVFAWAGIDRLPAPSALVSGDRKSGV